MLPCCQLDRQASRLARHSGGVNPRRRLGGIGANAAHSAQARDWGTIFANTVSFGLFELLSAVPGEKHIDRLQRNEGYQN